MDILLLLTLSIILLLFILNYNKLENFIDYKTCAKKNIKNPMKKIFDDLDSKRVTDDWELYLPCNYTFVESEITKLDVKEDQYVFGITGSDIIASKNKLYETLKKKYKNSNVSVGDIYPKSYLIKNINDKYRFKKDFNKKKQYILKKNIQQQKGIKLSNNYKFILKVLNSSEYNIVQELLPDPLLVNKRKINLRVYYLIICNKGKKSFYIYNDGFIYYTRKHYNTKILDFDHHITTGYIDRQVYAENPLTHSDLYEYLEDNGYDSNKLKRNIIDLMKKISYGIENSICNVKHLNKCTTFQLFGCDVAPDKDLNCILIEINKGPDLNYKDERDGNLKQGVMKGIFNLLKIDNNLYENNFIKL